MSNPNSHSRLSLIVARLREWDFLSLLLVTLLFLLVLSTLLPIWSGERDTTSALPVNVHARLTADYSKDPYGTSFPPVGLRVIRAALFDDNPFATDIDMRLATMTQQIEIPVPTSTGMLPVSTQSIATVPPESALTFEVEAATASAAATKTVTPVSSPTRASLTLVQSPSPVPTSSTPSLTNVTSTRTPTVTGTIVANASATTASITCQSYPSSGLAATQDTWIDSSNPDSSNADASKLTIEPGAREKQALMQFDLTSIPSGSTVETATLYLDMIRASTYSVNLYRVLDAWSEDVTWNRRPTYDASVSMGSLNLMNEGICVRAVSLDRALIEDWIDYPNENHGVIAIVAIGTGLSEYRSSESASGPKLVITYVP